ncbi:MAG: hypothetical protein IJW68_06805 [Bacteroidaceae bacterium]|nr:hypothetical protein [Bacteroidaceae bacterium]
MQLSFGPLKISISGVTEKEVPANTLLFTDESSGLADVSYTFRFVSTLPPPTDAIPIIKRTDIEIYRDGALEMRRLGIKDTPGSTYAVIKEIAPNEVEIFFDESKKSSLVIDTIFISCLALERYMAQCKAIILHCAFLAYNNKALLFSGPSGIGKSTHSNLWCKHIADTKVVNGDRCLIYRNKEGEYIASGWPVCGSSEICHREEYPLHSIILLHQCEENIILNATPMQKFKQLCSQTTINWWDKQHAEKMLDEIEMLTSKTPIVNYACNMTAEAPETLRKYLDGK